MEAIQPAENQKKNRRPIYASLDDFRIKNNLSYSELGRLWGVPTMTAHHYVSGKIKIPKKKALNRIHQITGVPIQTIIFQKEISPVEIYCRNEKMTGPKNPRWNGGASEYQDHYLLKKRRIDVLKKAGGKCRVCGERAFIVHHIDEDKANHDIKNLIPLCNKCHWAIHKKELGERQSSTSKFIREYGKSAKEIANHFNISEQTIRNCLKFGLTPPLVKRNSPSDILREQIKKFLEEHHQ